MTETFETVKVLITVMTYPHPSESYKELVCTAGITETREWVRLYPIDYRYRPREQQFRKYQWINIDLSEKGSNNDNRKESRKPNLESLKVLGPPIDTADAWRERRAIIDAMPHYTVKQLQELYNTKKVSLGLVRPTQVVDLKIELASLEWKPSWQNLFDQFSLFGPPQKPLRKIPYKFSYIFNCEDSNKPHNAMIEDWELGTLFLKEAGRLGSDERAADSVKNKFLNEICRADKDTRFFMGTIFPYNSWVVLGTFWPPKQVQPKQVQMKLPL